MRSWIAGAALFVSLLTVGAARGEGPRIDLTEPGLTAWREPTGAWTIVSEAGLMGADPARLAFAAGNGAIANGRDGRTSNLISRREFGDCHVHAEFIIASHSNSGLYLMGRYEAQIYDSFGKKSDAYPGIECGGIYPRWIDNRNVEGHSPRVNASKPAGEWQTFDIDFRAPRFDADGKKIADAVVAKLVLNGQVVQENVELKGPTRSSAFDDEKPVGPVMLQGDHGPVAFRNVWVREVEAGPETKPARFELPTLKVSKNRHFLVTSDGKPFFWLGDTAWELFHRLTREEADRYLEDRAAKGFTVIQAVALAESDGTTVPSAAGFLPLIDQDPARPALSATGGDDYWREVDATIDRANALGMYVGLLPTWGKYWHDPIKAGKPLFNPANAETYGRWIGQRYKNKGIIWILGGDRPIDNDEQREVIRAMARGLKEGDGGRGLIAFHPPGGAGSSNWFQNDDWLDVNLRQNGHAIEWTGRYELTRRDYDRTPTKPVIDAEPIYEDHPISFNARMFGYSVAADVRRAIYWDLFSGACGHTYGNHAVWQFYSPARKPINGPLMPWTQAIEQPGAGQMRLARRLIESRPILSRVPDDDVVVQDTVKSAVPGAGTRRFAATRDAAGSYAMIYVPVGRPFRVRMSKIAGPRVKAWWYNPRTGAAQDAGEFSNEGEREFVSPDRGELLDWVLVLDDAAKHYPPPGG